MPLKRDPAAPKESGKPPTRKAPTVPKAPQPTATKPPTTKPKAAKPAAPKKAPVTPVRRRRFLEKLAQTGNVSAAARAAALTRRLVYELRARDPDFAADWEMAIDEAMDDLEEALRDRAITGVPKPSAKAGGEARNYSDSAGLYILKSRRGAGAEGDQGPEDGENPRETLMRRFTEMRGEDGDE